MSKKHELHLKAVDVKRKPTPPTYSKHSQETF